MKHASPTIFLFLTIVVAAVGIPFVDAASPTFRKPNRKLRGGPRPSNSGDLTKNRQLVEVGANKHAERRLPKNRDGPNNDPTQYTYSAEFYTQDLGDDFLFYDVNVVYDMKVILADAISDIFNGHIAPECLKLFNKNPPDGGEYIVMEDDSKALYQYDFVPGNTVLVERLDC